MISNQSSTTKVGGFGRNQLKPNISYVEIKYLSLENETSPTKEDNCGRAGIFIVRRGDSSTSIVGKFAQDVELADAIVRKSCVRGYEAWISGD